MDRHKAKHHASETKEEGWYASSSGFSARVSTFDTKPAASYQRHPRRYNPPMDPQNRAMAQQSEKADISPTIAKVPRVGTESMEQNKYARFADAAYHYGDTDYYKQSFSHVRGMEDFKLDMELSTKESSIFHNDLTGETVYAVRGTVLGFSKESFSDYSSDLDIANFAYDEKNDRRFKAEAVRFKATIAKYGKENLNLAGHSLGADIAAVLSIKFDVPGYGYNPGFGIQRAVENGGKGNTSMLEIYTTKADPVSIGRAFMHDTATLHFHTTSQKNYFDMHGTSNFMSNQKQNEDGTFDDVHGSNLYSDIGKSVSAINHFDSAIMSEAAKLTKSIFSDLNPVSKDTTSLHDAEHVMFEDDWYDDGDVIPGMDYVIDHTIGNNGHVAGKDFADKYANQAGPTKFTGDSDVITSSTGVRYVDVGHG